MIIFLSRKPQKRAIQCYNEITKLRAKLNTGLVIKNRDKLESKISELEYKLKVTMEEHTPVEIEIDPSKAIGGHLFYRVPSHPDTAYGCLDCHGLIMITSDFKSVSNLMNIDTFIETYGNEKRTITCYCTECKSDGKCRYDGCRYFPHYLYD